MSRTIPRDLVGGSIRRFAPWYTSKLRRCSFKSTAALRSTTPLPTKIDVDQLLSKSTWSVASLLTSRNDRQSTSGITPEQLRHLLRLSALPPPKDETEEKEMLSTLSAQLHFVKQIQQVDTTGVDSLKSLRDETSQGEKEAELGLEALREALDQEEVKGKHHRRIRRKRAASLAEREKDWDVLETAERRVGRLFVVDGGKDR